VHFLSPDHQSGIHCLIICVFQLLTLNNLGATWRRICSLDIWNITCYVIALYKSTFAYFMPRFSSLCLFFFMVVTTSAADCLDGFVSEMIYYVSSGTSYFLSLSLSSLWSFAWTRFYSDSQSQRKPAGQNEPLLPSLNFISIFWRLLFCRHSVTLQQVHFYNNNNNNNNTTTYKAP